MENKLNKKKMLCGLGKSYDKFLDFPAHASIIFLLPELALAHQNFELLKYT